MSFLPIFSFYMQIDLGILMMVSDQKSGIAFLAILYFCVFSYSVLKL